MAKFAITVEVLEASFEAGFQDAAHSSITAENMREILAPFSGAKHRDAVASWEEIRKSFIAGLEAGGMQNASARQRWSRLIKETGLVKPQTPEAIKKASARAAAKPSSDVTPITLSAPVAELAQVMGVGVSARLTACIELLKRLDAERLIRAQNLILELFESEHDDEESPF